MKIAIISHYFSESTLPLAKALQNIGNTVYYFYIHRHDSTKEIPGMNIKNSKLIYGINKINENNAPELFRYLDRCNISIYIIYLPPKIITSKIVQFCYYVFLKIMFLKFNFDIVNIVGHADVLIIFHKLFNKKKLIHTLHEVYDHSSSINFMGKLLNLILNSHLPIIVHSETSYNRILKYPQANKNLIYMIPYGLFETYQNYTPKTFEFNRDVILFYGTMLPYKGIDVLKDSIYKLNDRGISAQFVIAGKGNLEELKEIASIPNCRVINKYLTNEEIVGLNLAAKVIVCPYKSASQSGIIMTSFLFNKPIIATRVGGFNEIIKDRVTGILINPNSAEELSDAIETVLKDKNLYSSLCRNISSFGKTGLYSWNQIAKRTELVFKSVIQK